MKKVLALVLAAVMVMALCGTVFAAAGDLTADATITVTGLANGDVAKFYQVAEWIADAAGNVGGWGEVPTFASAYDLEAVLKGVGGAAATGITAEVAKALAAAAPTTADGTDNVGSDGKAELDVSTLGPGIYMVLVSAADKDVVYNPIFVSADWSTTNTTSTYAVDATSTYSNHAAAKKSTTTLDKTASTEENAPDDEKWQTVAIGDTVHFTVKTTIPGFGPAFIDPYFKVTDKLTDLNLVTTSVAITSPTIASSNYDLTASASGYSITFEADYLKTLAVATEITIEYDALVATTANLNVNTEKNEVWTEFSHDINNTEDHAFKKDTTQHYTFTIDANAVLNGGEGHGERTSELVKVGIGPDGNPITKTKKYSAITSEEYWQGPLEGAHFKLYRTYDKSTGALTDEYIPKNAAGQNQSVLDIVSDAEGRMTIKGLDAGTYYLVETSAPAGFIKDDHVAEIVITANTTSKNVTEYTKDGVTWLSAAAYEALSDKTGYKSYTFATETLDSYTITVDGNSVASYTFTNDSTEIKTDWTEHPPVEHPHEFVNNQGLELPSTGGIGTTIFYISGLIMVLGAATILVARRRADAE